MAITIGFLRGSSENLPGGLAATGKTKEGLVDGLKVNRLILRHQPYPSGRTCPSDCRMARYWALPVFMFMEPVWPEPVMEPV